MFNTEKMILTGAGASIPLNIPGMRGMAKQFKEHIKRDTNLLKVYKSLTKHGASEDIEELLEFANETIEFTNRPISSFIEACVAPQQGTILNKFRKRRDVDIDNVKKFRTELLTWISNTCLAFDRPKAEAIYGDFVEIVTAQNIPVYTTNYDAVLDYVASRKNIPVADNFVETNLGRFFWEKNLTAFDSDGFTLINIHGSIQWHGSDDGRIEKIPQPASVNREGQPLSQLMIFPTRFKDIYQQNYFPLYASFTRTLGVAKVLFVIGHSLRDEYLLAAIRERLRDKDFLLVVINPSFEVDNEIFNGPSDPRRQRVFHISGSIESVYPVLLQAIQDIPISDISHHMTEIMHAVKRNRTDKLKITSTNLHGKLGQSIEITLDIESYIGGGMLKSWIEIKKDPKDKQAITFSLKPDIKKINGHVKEQTTMTLTIPKKIGLGSHNLYVGLERPNGGFKMMGKRAIRIK